MNIIEQNDMSDWIDIFNERLHYASSPLPDDELEVLEKMIHRRKLARRAAWYIGAAAASFVIGFYFIKDRDNSIQENYSIQDNYTPSLFLADGIPSEESECQENKPDIIPLFEKKDIEETIQEDNCQPESIDLKLVPEENTTPSGNSDSQGHQYSGDFAFEQPENIPGNKRNWALGFSFRGLNTSFGNQLLDGIPNLQSEPISYHHYSPLSVGISIQLKINKSLFLSSGIDYMYCHSRVSYSEMISNIQDAHYLRIPLLLNTQLFQGRDFSFYVGAGMEASKLLYAKEGGVRLKDDNIYCSATALAGFRYNVTPDVGITLEPIYSHTFLPIEKPVLTTLTDKPDLFSIRIGLSFDLN